MGVRRVQIISDKKSQKQLREQISTIHIFQIEFVIFSSLVHQGERDLGEKFAKKLTFDLPCTSCNSENS